MEAIIIIILLVVAGAAALRYINRHKFEEIKYNLKNWFNK
jgi:hypothetical protein|tara:strand:+ start:568 stop:687 length:120 start_codon:yes stop_codon:yes gene_type:complete